MEALKQSLVALKKARKTQCLWKLCARGWRHAHTAKKLRYTTRQRSEVQRRTRGPPTHINEAVLAKSLLLNPRETLASIWNNCERSIDIAVATASK